MTDARRTKPSARVHNANREHVPKAYDWGSHLLGDPLVRHVNLVDGNEVSRASCM